MSTIYRSRVLAALHSSVTMFTPEFLAFLPENVHVFEAFEREALRIVGRGWTHYSARTIVEVLRHHHALAESAGPWKLNDWHTPYLARLFALLNPEHAELFEFRAARVSRGRIAANADFMHQAGGDQC